MRHLSLVRSEDDGQEATDKSGGDIWRTGRWRAMMGAMDELTRNPPPSARPRRVRLSVRTLLALVACCASLLWAWKTVEEADPTTRLVRQLRRGDTAARRGAAEELGGQPVESFGLAAPALAAALRDGDAT